MKLVSMFAARCRHLGMATALLSVAALAACGGGGGDGPTEPSGPSNANVSGSWNYSAPNVSGLPSSPTCNISGVIMTLSQSGTSITGNYSGGRAFCSAPGVGTMLDETVQGAVASGTVSGNNVAFDFHTAGWRNTGTASGNSISGTVVFVLNHDASGGDYTLTGSFTATKR